MVSNPAAHNIYMSILSGYDPASLEGIVNYVGECDSTSPCNRCQGDCDSDEDCADGLVCLQRDGFEAVPGKYCSKP